MKLLPIVALTLATTASPVMAQDHVVTLDHRSGSVEARYRGAVMVTHRQIGAVAPGGRASTLRCTWHADLAVTREARGTVGIAASRSFGRDGLFAGSRPGWCDTARRAIADEVASRAGEVDTHLRALAQEDHAPLRAELDRLHAGIGA
ncbi:hypothetical protein [Sphingomonas rubra]|uniref:hypothetical protein n=1 Tax=Sphingomonas rubra TaxID=634430 RepID=UPI000B8674F1|nr:hypothetical protein [Sphingomonas rubra]